MVEDMESLGSPVGAFVRDRCRVGAGLRVSVADLFALWKNWCEVNGRREHGTVQTFGRDLLAAVPSLNTRQPRDEAGQRQRVYEGIGIVGQVVRRIP
jgi:putative DNA primase/helicase